MKSFRTAAVAILLASTSNFATAYAAVDAAAVQKNLQAYLGAEPGVVTVAPFGEDVQITLDIMPYLNKAAIPDSKITVTPVVMIAHPNGGGTWDVKSSSPLSFDMQSPAATIQYKMQSFDWTGTFDEDLRGFSKSNAVMSNVNVDQNIADPNTGVKTKVAYVIGKYAADTIATKRDAGIADVVSSITASDIKGTWSSEGDGAGLPGGSFTAGKVAAEAKSTGLRQRAVMDLLAWFVSHPSKDAIIKDQADLKKSLSAAMPFFESVNMGETLESISVQTPIGPVTAQSAKIGFDMAGLTKEGRFGETIELSGLVIPQGLAPPWAADLVPTNTALGFSATGFDAEAPATIFIDKMDLSKEPPLSADVSPALMAAAMPSGSFKISLPPTTITAPAYNISMTGGIEMTMLGPKGGNLDIKMKGLDAVAAKLQEAAQSDPQAAQAIAGVIAAKGMAKTDADGNATWAIIYSPEGKITVNGLDLGAMAPPAQ